MVFAHNKMIECQCHIDCHLYHIIIARKHFHHTAVYFAWYYCHTCLYDYNCRKTYWPRPRPNYHCKYNSKHFLILKILLKSDELSPFIMSN